MGLRPGCAGEKLSGAVEQSAAMSEELVIRRRPAHASPLRMRRVGAALDAPAGALAIEVAFPGIPNTADAAPKDRLLSGAVSTLLHLGALGALILLGSLTPVIQEELLPVELLKEEAPQPKAEPKEAVEDEPLDRPDEESAPAPKALAERRAAQFAPQAQALTPQVINPTVVARVAPAVTAERVEMDAVATTAAPREIAASKVVVERASAVQSIASAVASKVDTSTAAPALRGPTDATLPAGPSVGPRPIVQQGDTVGTGTAVSLGDTSSVRDGIASTRDVLGSPDGAPLANVNTRVGQGLLKGDGGTGDGQGGSDGDCLNRPEVIAYYSQHIESRMKSRWVIPAEIPKNQQRVVLRFALDVGGSLTRAEVAEATNAALGVSAMEALRAASPFAPMSERVRCLARRTVRGSFRVDGVTGN